MSFSACCLFTFSPHLMKQKLIYILAFIAFVLVLFFAIPKKNKLERLNDQRLQLEEQIHNLQLQLSWVEMQIGEELWQYGILWHSYAPVVYADYEKPLESGLFTWASEQKTMYTHQDKNPLPPIEWNTPAKRLENLVKYYARGFDMSVFVEARNAYKIPEELLVCIAYAETHLGNANKSTNNIMNYGNNDRWHTRSEASVRDNVMEVARALREGKYLWRNTILWELSWWGRQALWLAGCGNGNYCYATSMENWRGNVYDCLTMIHWANKDRDNWNYKWE